MKPKLPLRAAYLAVCFYAATAVLTWNLVRNNVKAQTCAVPQTMGEAGDPNAGRWAISNTGPRSSGREQL